jgi:hypothetical protein
MKRVIGVVGLLCAAFVFGACNKGSGSSGAAASDGTTGIQECDVAIKKMASCSPSDPGTKAGWDATKDAWVQNAKDPAKKASMQATCKTMLTTLASSPDCK